MYKKAFPFVLVVAFFVTIMIACIPAETLEAPPITPPAIGMEISGDFCPSTRVQAGAQITWTNKDDVDRILILKRTDENGALVDAGGTDLLQPGSTFSITLTEPGQYTYYCSKDGTVSGQITVLP